MNFVHRISGRGLIAYFHDIVMSGVAFALALYLRLGDDIFLYAANPMVEAGILFMSISAVVFWLSGLYRGVWRYASMNDLLAITRAVHRRFHLFAGDVFVDPFPAPTPVYHSHFVVRNDGGAGRAPVPVPAV